MAYEGPQVGTKIEVLVRQVTMVGPDRYVIIIEHPLFGTKRIEVKTIENYGNGPDATEGG